MSALVDRSGVRQLDTKAQPDSAPTEDEVQDPSKLVRIVAGLLKDVATLKRRFVPRRIDFRDITVDGTGTTIYRFVHNFGGRVNWWVLDWRNAVFSAQPIYSNSSTNDVLMLTFLTIGTISIRVEEAG
jgi:hypothetical protein